MSTDLLAPKRFWLGRGGEQDLLVAEEAWAVAPASVNHGNNIPLGWLSPIWGFCQAQQGYCYPGQCLPETVWEGRGSLCCNHPAVFLHLPSLLSQQCRKCSSPWRNLSISSGPGKEALSPCFLVQNTWTPSCRWPSGTSQPPLIRAFLVCGQLLGGQTHSGVFVDQPVTTLARTSAQNANGRRLQQGLGCLGWVLLWCLKPSPVWSSILSCPPCVQQT